MLSRRQFVEFGARGVAAWALTDVLRGGWTLHAQQPVTPKGTAKTCIFVMMLGGPTHLETWDVKEGAWSPRDLDIQDYGSGLTLSRRLFPQIASHAKDLVLVRSMEAWDNAHDRAQYYLQTSYSKNPAFFRERPSIGTVVAYEADASRKPSEVLPAYVALNGMPIGPGFFKAEYAPFGVTSSGTGIGTLLHPQGRDRFARRYAMLDELDRGLRASPYDKEMDDLASFTQVSRALMYNDQVDAMFRFTTAERNRYGNTAFGNACIVARNVAQADLGARFITIMHGGWDQHQSLFDANSPASIYGLGRQFDTGLGTLLDDLRSSPAPQGRVGSLLDNTLVVAMGDFGRTPGNLNARGGRDHYRNVQAALMIGGGVRGGKAIGRTDSTGANIVDFGWSGSRSIRMEDITATIYSALGINWTKSISNTPSGRKYEYVQWGAAGLYRPVDEVFR